MGDYGSMQMGQWKWPGRTESMGNTLYETTDSLIESEMYAEKVWWGLYTMQAPGKGKRHLFVS